MMTNRHNAKHDKFILYTVEQLVPQDHLVRKLEDAIDWNVFYDKVAHLYSTAGRPSIDPVVMIKMIVINKVFGLNSMRKTCRELEVNLAYRWFIGYDIDEKIPEDLCEEQLDTVLKVRTMENCCAVVLYSPNIRHCCQTSYVRAAQKVKENRGRYGIAPER